MIRNPSGGEQEARKLQRASLIRDGKMAEDGVIMTKTVNLVSNV